MLIIGARDKNNILYFLRLKPKKAFILYNIKNEILLDTNFQKVKQYYSN
jgi:hypothetical protein